MAGFNAVKVNRRQVWKRLKANTAYTIPAGASVRRFQAVSRNAQAVSLRAGNAAAGEQFVAATAVPTNGTPIDVVPLISGLSNVPTVVYISSAAWGTAEVDVALEYTELLDSKSVPFHDPV